MSYSRLNDPAVDDPIPLASVNTTAGRTKHQRDQSLGHTYNNNPFDDVNSVGNAPGPMPQKSRLKPTNMNAFSRFAEKRGAGRKIRPTDKKRKIQLLKSYAPDWILTIILAAAFFALDEFDGYRRVFSLDDTSLRHPYTEHERIPNKLLMVIAVLVPFLLLILINAGTIRSWWDFHNSTLGLVLGLALTGAVTQFTKLTVGRPRPDIIARCIPKEGAADPLWGLSDSSICTRTESYIIKDGFRSFPSGHSSLSFAGLGFLSYYIAGKLHLFDERGHAGKAWLSLAPFSAAALVAISRTMDYRHHWQDVLVGSILGTVLSYFAYRQYYPPLTSELAHRPYSPRVRRDDDDLYDDETLPTTSINGGGYLPTHHRPSESFGGIVVTSPGGARYRENNSSGEIVQESDVVSGTVEHPGPTHLTDTWREGDREEERNVQRGRGEAGRSGLV